jgi:hypothetical protein
MQAVLAGYVLFQLGNPTLQVIRGVVAMLDYLLANLYEIY